MPTIHKLSIARAVLLAALALSASALCAQPSGTQPAEGQHRKPPQEAFDACKASKAGQDCNFASPHGAVKGACFAPEGKPLACKPTNPPNDAPPKK